MKRSSLRRLMFASLLVLLAVGGGCVGHTSFVHSLSAALEHREGPFPGDAPSAGPQLTKVPLIERPAQGGGKTLAVMYSGDGGWAKAADSVARGIAGHGVATVGIDSMRYFWPGRTPEGAAADLTAVIDRYRAVWGKDEVVIVGFSFGGDAVPMILPHLSAETRSHLKAVILLAPTGGGSMIVRPRNWLDLKSDKDVPLGPLLARFQGGRLICVYGRADKVTACPRLLPQSQLVAVEGGHHFGNKFGAVADAAVKAAGL